MKDYLLKLPDDILKLVYLARDTASKLHCKAYLIGGFVRDLILGVDNFDVDIAVEGNGIQFAEACAHALGAKIVSHPRFKTATVSLKHHLKLDIASIRKEHYPHPGSLPVVTSGRLEDDLARRDFTINAVAIDITEQHFGTLVDLFNGVEDMRYKKIRVLHGLSFIDDPTRILRAIRFEQRFGFKMEQKTLRLLKNAASSNMLFKVEPQRLRDELILILKEKYPIKPLIRLHQLAELSFISPGLSVTKTTKQFFSNIDKEVVLFKKDHAHRRHLDAWLMYLMGLLDYTSLAKVKRICKTFIFRKGEEKRLLSFKQINDTLITKLSADSASPSKIHALLLPFSYEVILTLKAKYRKKRIGKRIFEFLSHYNGVHIALSGHDLKALGIAPGPCYQKFFKKVLVAKLDGRISTKEEEIALVKKLAGL